MSNHPPTISIVIPVYNSAPTLQTLTTRLETVLNAITGEYEIIFINDGSRDDSWNSIQMICKKHPRVAGINLLRNFGQHNAVLCGIRQAKYEIIITMDDDLQHPPEEIPLLMQRILDGADVVYGIPEKMPHSFFRNLSSWLVKRILAFVMGIKTIKDISAFRAFHATMKLAFTEYRSSGVIIDVLLSWATTNFASVVVKENPREIGKSNYTFSKLLKQAFLILTGYSTVPLRFASILGFSFTLFGFAVLIYVLIIYFTLGSIPGFPFLASIISLFSGVQMLVLGIIGEYLARVFDRSMDRPPYIIGSIIDHKNQQKHEPQ